MLNLTYAGIEFTITFMKKYYTYVPSPFPDGGEVKRELLRGEVKHVATTKQPLLINTVCKVSVHSGSISKQEACQNPMDQYCKWFGKKLALSRALDYLETYDILALSKTESGYKSFRKAVWEVFFKAYPQAKKQSTYDITDQTFSSNRKNNA